MSSERQERPSRRDFFRLGAAGVAAAGLAGCLGRGVVNVTVPVPQVKTPQPPPPPPPPPPPYGRYDMGVQSYSFRRFSFDETLARTEQLGLHFIEFTPGHLAQNSNAEQLAAAQAKMADRHIRANAYGVCGLERDEQRNRALFDFLRRAEIGVVSADPSPDSFDVLDKLVAEYNIKVAIHNHGPGTRWSRTDQMLDATRSHHAAIGVCLDTGHLTRSGENPVESVRRLGPRLLALHLKDVNRQNNDDVVIGRGRLDLVAFFTALREVRFSGPCSLEFELNETNPDPGIAESLAALREAIARVG